ncbi:MAG: hypothetical protein E7331_12675 [Clostridiales bacterium]|nr:hypothetical protein [Clostridiales bacterium]
MKTYVPEYYFDFQCISSRCRHTCCAGWEIDLDEDTLCRYAGVSGSLGQELRKAIAQEEDGSAHFLLQGEEERCPFLREDGLCRLILQLGEESLSQICTDHPRFRNEVGGREEMGLGLCCEAAAELILEWNKPFRLVELPGAKQTCSDHWEDGADEDRPSTEAAAFLQWRQQLTDWLYTSPLPFSQKLEKMLSGRVSSLVHPATISALCEGLEYMDEEWHRLMESMEETQPWPPDAAMQRRLVNLMVYFIYRHMHNLLEDGRRDSWTGLCVLSTAAVWHAACMLASDPGRPTAAELADAARRYSSEVEYSDQNVDAIMGALADAFGE